MDDLSEKFLISRAGDEGRGGGGGGGGREGGREIGRERDFDTKKRSRLQWIWYYATGCFNFLCETKIKSKKQEHNCYVHALRLLKNVPPSYLLKKNEKERIKVNEKILKKKKTTKQEQPNE